MNDLQACKSSLLMLLLVTRVSHFQSANACKIKNFVFKSNDNCEFFKSDFYRDLYLQTCKKFQGLTPDSISKC